MEAQGRGPVQLVNVLGVEDFGNALNVPQTNVMPPVRNSASCVFVIPL